MANVAEQAIKRSVSHTEIVTIDYDAAAAADLAVECDDSIEANEVTEYWGRDEEGSEWRVHMRHAVLPAEAVIVETMPDQFRGSHRAANNWGVYPHNGATRSIMSREAADELVAGDEDEYDHIVRDAEPSDAGKYEVAS